MPKAEVGSIKHLAKQMKAKGLQRLRWYCQICGKQCRDENGFKQHTMSEGHVRAMLLVGEDPKKFIREYSRQFQRDFLQLLKTSHGEKKVHMNNFYQEYIRDKEHIHMNATQWPSLTEFAKHLGREGICRVEEGERGLEIAWIDDSAEAIKRKEEIRKMDARAKGDEELESRLLEQQIKRAREAEEARARDAAAAAEANTTEDSDNKTSQEPASTSLEPPPKLSLSLKSRAPTTSSTTTPSTTQKLSEPNPSIPIESLSTQNPPSNNSSNPEPSAPPAKFSLSLKSKTTTTNPLSSKNKGKNVFSSKDKTKFAPEPEKKMSNAERIMKEEIERKRFNENGGGKRRRLA